MSVPLTQVRIRPRPVTFTDEQYRKIRDLMGDDKVLEAQRLMLNAIAAQAPDEQEGEGE